MSRFEELMRQSVNTDGSPLFAPKVPKESKQEGFFEDIASGVVEYGHNAVQNLNDVISQRIALNNELYKTGYFDGIDTDVDLVNPEAPIMTPEQEVLYNTYKESMSKLREETVRPLADYSGALSVAGLIGAAAVGTISAPAACMIGALGYLGNALLVNDLGESIEQNGVGGTAWEMAKGAVPIIPAIAKWNDPAFQQYLEEHPGRATMDLLQTGVNSLGIVSGAVGRAIPKGAKGIAKGGTAVKTRAKETLQMLKEKPFMEKVQADTIAKKVTEGMFEVKDQVEKGKIQPRPKSKTQKNIEGLAKEIEIKRNTTNDAPIASVGGRTFDVTPPTKVKNVKALSIFGTVEKLASINMGNFMKHVGKTTEGYFRPKGKGIRVKDPRDVDTILHEVTHYIDGELGVKGFDKELEDLHQKVYYNQSPYEPHQWREEGIAQFGVELLLNPEEAKKSCPGYYNAFTEALAKNPKMAKHYAELGEKARRWYHQPEEARYGGGVTHFENDIELQLDKQLNTLKQKAEIDFVDQFSLIDKITKGVTKASGEDLLYSEDPYIAFKNLQSNVNSHIEMLTTDTATPTKVAILNDILGGQVFVYNTFLGDVFNKLPKMESYLQVGKDVLEDLKAKGVNLDKLRDLKRKTPDTEYLNKIQAKDHYEGFSIYMGNLAYKARAEKLGRDKLKSLPVAIEKVKEAIEKVKADPKRSLNFKLIDRLEKYRDNLVRYYMDISFAGYDTRFESAYKMETAKSIIETAPKGYAEAAVSLKEVNTNLVNLLKHTGIIDAKMHTYLLTEYDNYVPLQRVFRQDREGFSLIEKGHHGSIVDGSDFIKTMDKEGSVRIIKDPIFEYVRTIEAAVARGHKNLALRKFVDLDKRVKGMDYFIEPVGSEQAASKDHIISVWKEGKKEFYQVKEPLLYETLTSQDAFTLDWVLRPLEWVSKTFRETTTIPLGFAFRNMLIDSFGAFVNSKSTKSIVPGLEIPFIPIVDSVIGAYRYATDSELRDTMKARGVTFSTRGGEVKHYRKDISNKYLGGQDIAPWHLLKKGWQGLEKINEYMEAAPRVQEYIRILKETGDAHLATEAAKTITVDFSQGGRLAKKYNRYTPFFNANIQGTRTFYNAYTNPKTRARALWRTAELASATMALWFMNHNEEWYRTASLDEKNRYWLFELDGEVRRIPKPELPGAFCSVLERILDHHVDNNVAATGSLKQYVYGYAPNMMPHAIKLFYELMTNKNFFTGTDIVPRDLQDEHPRNQWDNNTSYAARWAGDTFNLSPIQLDFIVGGIFSTTGREFSSFVDEIITLGDTNRPERKQSKLPILERVTSDPNKNSMYVQLVYEELDKTKKDDNEVGVKSKKQQGLQQAASKMSAIRRSMRQIEGNRRLSPKEKTRQIDALYKQRTKVAKEALSTYADFKY